MYETLSSRFSLTQGLARVSLGLTGALNRLSLGPSASRKDSLTGVRYRHQPFLTSRLYTDEHYRTWGSHLPGC